MSAQEIPNAWDVVRKEFKLNHEVSRPEVQEQIRWLVAHPGYLYKASQQSEPYIYHIISEIRKRQLPGELALVPMIESAYDPFAYSSAGASGLWQLMPKTATELGVKQDWWFDGRRSIGHSTHAALNFLVHLNKVFAGEWALAIAAYDAGEGAIGRSIKAAAPSGAPVSFWSLSVPAETKAYVPRLLALAEIISNPERYHVRISNIPYAPYFEEVNIGSQIDLNHAAQLAGMSYKELIKLNPGYNRWLTAPYAPFKLLIPTQKVAQFNWSLANISDKQKANWTQLRLQKNDKLNQSTVRYHTHANWIKPGNQLATKQSVPPTHNRFVPPSGTKNHRLIHIVQANDSYARLEQLYSVTMKEIQSWNNMAANDSLRQGQQLLIWKTIKPAVPYLVKPGDTIHSIAQTQHTSINTLFKLNPSLYKAPNLQTGQKILVG